MDPVGPPYMGLVPQRDAFLRSDHGHRTCKLGIDGAPAHLEPNRDSIQKSIEGLSVLALSTTNRMLKNSTKV